uniref:Ubiquitin carboxyl-terminal hydrolase n=1 Tax=Mastacembelus armatus TaxID=205130 RepID=A0A7N8X874_9TELE
MAEGGAADLDTQRGEVAALLKTQLRKGDTWYLVDSHWFKQWKKYVGYDSWDKYQMGDQNVYPGPVDNSGLLRDGDVLAIKEHLIDELDYILVPTEGWNKLVSWYGLTEGQEPIARKVGDQTFHCKVEVYLTELKLCEDSNMDNVITRRFSKADTIGRPSFECINLDKITVLVLHLHVQYYSHDIFLAGRILTNVFPTLYNLPFCAFVCLLHSVKNSSYSLSSYHPYSNSYDYSDQSRQSERSGLCGLSNLGNTCFMNSAVQCLSNIPPLTEYFLKDKYTDELNEDNPLGMKGEIARAYAELIKQLWSGKYSYVTPRPFKTQVGRFAPQFSGYQQQDSHELLAFLLDGLHEDLNRIRKKPYIQLKDANGRPDKVVAEEAWENHIKRNDSIIVDIFHGLFKSTLVCPVCSKVSVTFDPFCYLTLPLPMKKERTLEVYLVRLDPLTKPTQYKLTVPKVGYISDLCTSLSILSGVPAEKMIVTDIYNHRFHRIFATNENLSMSVLDNKVEDTDHVVIPVHLREKYKQSGYNQSSTPLFGQPFLIAVPRTLSEDKLYNMLLLTWYECTIKLEMTHQICVTHLFTDRSYLSLDWEPEIKKKYFDETVVEDFDKHESMEYKPQKKAFFKLKDCIELFTTKEKLGAEDPWYCPNCKQHQQATKKLDLWSLPPVLVVHLKRFSYSRYMRDKLDSLVDFPLRDLDMSEFLINPNAGPCRYDLIAVSNHYGGMGGGHYTAYAKNKDDGKWYNFDDSSVSPANEDQIVSKAGYVLFYQRQDTVKGTGYFALDREEEEEDEEEEEEEEEDGEEEENDGEERQQRKPAASAAGAAAQSDEEDLNENRRGKNDNEPGVHDEEEEEEELAPNRDVTMKTN